MASQSLLRESALAGRGLAFRAAQPRASRRPAQLLVQARKDANANKESRIGKKPISIPKGVDVKVDGQHVVVKGPKGQLEQTIPEVIEIKQEDGGLRLYKREENRRANEMHGLSRSLLNNMVVGTSEGFTKTLSMVGVGYRAAAKGEMLVLNLGYSHPVELEVPKGLTVQVEKNTTINVSGFDKCLVGQFAATVRSKRPPEPYKGKGVRYSDEFVARKEGKKGK